MSDIQEWFYTDDAGQEVGPATADQLQELAASGQITAQTDVWTEGLEKWLPASQVDGLIPAQPTPAPPPIPQQPAHQPQINLGPATGIHLESTITPRPMGTPTHPYAPQMGKTPKSPVKWIVLGAVALVVLVFGIIIATSPSEEDKIRDIPGYAEYTSANKLVSSTKKGGMHGNNTEALEVSKKFAILLKQYREFSIEKTSPGLLNKNGIFPTYCMVKSEGDVKSVVIIVQVPKLRKFADDAKQAIAEGAWISAKLALLETPYNDPKTKLVVGIRGLSIYSKVMIGNPLMTKSPDEFPLEGMTKSHDGINSEDKLYPFFVRKK